MAKKRLNELIDEKFDQEQKRHEYGKKPKTPLGRYAQPAMFGVILVVSLCVLFSQIYTIAKYFLGQ